MLSNKTFYENEHVGRVKLSSSCEAFHYKNRTLGLALKYVTSGVEYYSVNHKRIQVRRGQYILLRQDAEYHAHSGDSIAKGVCIDLTSAAFCDETFYSGLPLNTPINCNGVSKIGKLVYPMNPGEMAVSEEEGCRRLSGDRAISEIEKSLTRLRRDLEAIRNAIAQDAKKESTRLSLALKLQETRDFIRNDPFRKIPLGKLEAVAGLSKYHLTRLFKASFDKTPREFQEDLRMGAAREMVIGDRMPLTQLAHHLGYSDLAAFSNRFHSYWRCRPSELRRN